MQVNVQESFNFGSLKGKVFRQACLDDCDRQRNVSASGAKYMDLRGTNGNRGKITHSAVLIPKER